MNRTKIDVRIEGDIALVTLNGPPKNEMGIEFFSAFADFTRGVRALGVRGMILTGAGRHFSSGADVPEIETLGAASDGKVASLLRQNIQSFLTLSMLPYPVVAAVSGCCLGAGFELALACHLRIAEPNAVFALPEVTWGIMPGCGGSVRLPKLIGKSCAAELILTGRSLQADEAHKLGIVDRLAPRGGALQTARALIHPETSDPS